MAKKDSHARLGRGLAALLGEQAPQLARAGHGVPQPPAQNTLPVDVLESGPFQPRQDIDPDHLAELADSIRSRGVLQPILVRPDPARPGRYQIIAGERRWRASQLAGLHTIPVHIRTLDDTDAMAAALVENLQRSDLNPIEEAEGLHRLIEDHQLTQEELAGAIGKSRPHIANMMRLLNLPEAVRLQLRNGALSVGHARALLGHPDPVAAMKIVIEKGLNVRQTEALAKTHHTPKKEPTAPDAEISHLERDLSAQLGLNVKISFNGKGGAVRIHYRSLEQFDAVLRLLKADG